MVYVRPLPEFGPETSKFFGATLLLAHIAQDVGLSTALTLVAEKSLHVNQNPFDKPFCRAMNYICNAPNSGQDALVIGFESLV